MSKTPEILAPAGDLERLRAAVAFGADAVYLGGKMFGMRSSPANFGPDELKSAVGYCHENGVKVYLTCNTLPSVEEADMLPEFIRAVSESRVDALIVADVGVMALARQISPELPLHVSTQAGVTNHLAAREFLRLGASRVILARELSLADIGAIRRETPPELELEAFVHGAMCMAEAGRCLLSQYFTGRSANRGDCAQPCRWSYHLMEEKREGLYLPVFEDERGSYILNAQDLCMLEHIDKLIEAGVSSFKIEGRAKSAYYVAAITNAYRLAADLYAENPGHYRAPQWLLDEALKVSHRQYSTGFYFPVSRPAQYLESDGYVREWEVVAVVEGYEDGFLICGERNRFSAGEKLELLMPGRRPEPFTVTEMLDADGNALETARHPMMRVKIPCGTACPAGSMLRRQK